MEFDTPLMDHPKRRRRRRKIDRSPLAATLVLDPDLRGEEGFLSANLYEELFPWSTPEDRQLLGQRPQYVGVSRWTPQLAGPYEDHEWAILPVKISGPEEDSAGAPIVRCPASCQAAQVVFQATPSTNDNKVRLKGTSTARILVLDVAPIELTTIYVNVDGNALDRHEQIQREYGGGFGSFRANGSVKKGKGKTKDLSSDGIHGEPPENETQQQENELTAAVRSALGSCSVIRQGDFLPLPLPTHPITHVPLPPAKIICCEPVNQGLLAANTQIVVNRQNGDLSSRLGPANHPTRDHSRYSDMENGEESSAEHFFSANETLTNGHVSEDNDDIGSSESGSAGDQSSSESDNSEDNTISLSAPSLPERPNAFLSSTIATPKIQSALHGTSTPGSVFSSFTARSTRQSSGIGRTFQPCSLLAPMPIDLLHPRPADDEDDEARVYVGVKNLLRLRCFSGDWVKLQGISSRNNLSDTWGLGAFDGASNENDKDFRVAKIYGLPTSTVHSSLHRSAKELTVSRRASNVSNHLASRDLIHQAWLSPVLLANLSSPDEIRIIPMMLDDAQRPFSPKIGLAKAAPSNCPPLAAEVSLAKIASPISQESAMQEMLYLRLKQYFETRRRIVKSGDLIAVLIDVSAGRSLGSSNTGNENGQEMEDLLSLVGKASRQHASSFDVVWFMVGSITKPTKHKQETNSADDQWGPITFVDPAITRMTMSNNRQDRMPPSSQNPWRTYLGVAPRPSFAGSSGLMVKYLSTPPKPFVSTTQRRLRELMAAASSARAEHLGIEPTLILLHSTQRNIGKFRISTQAVSDLGLHSFSIDAYDIISEGNAGDVQESSINTRIARALSCGAQNTALIIRHLEALTSNRMVAALKKSARDIRILVATTTQLDQLPETLRSLFTHEIELSAPDERERKGILRNIIEEQGLRLGHDVDLAAVAVKTAALVAGNLVDIVDRAVVARQERLDGLNRQINGLGFQTTPTFRDLLVSGGEWACCVIKADFDLAVEAARKNFADAIGAPKIPNVSWDDVGGLENVKDAVMETIQLPLERPELFAKGMKKRSGILFYGPPGTGKTLLAKAIATEFSLNFFSVKGPELLNMYIGESEANVRRVFQRARDARPCVVFFDELDSVAPKRGNQGDSGGVMDRIVSQLLAELDGMSNGEDGGGGVFVIGATNRPDLLDRALLRPGRFDKMLYLGISDTHRKQQTILEALTRKFNLHPGLSLARVAESLPFTYTGADLYALCSDAMLKAITRQASAVDAKIKALPNGPVTTAYFFDHLATKDDIAVTVSESDFQAASRELVGSVSAKELEHYQRVRQSFEAPSQQPSSASIPRNLPFTTRIQQPMPTRPKFKNRSDTAIRSTKDPTDPSGKGKGKAPRISRSCSDNDDDDDDDDDAYVTSNDSPYKSPERKGKQRATMIPKPIDGFRDPAVDDEADIYS
ncbi:MAG: hypothetical protein LQ337_006827 [Flavoplaca oasis]|nr:MAG: hypothetical protein LQ337_006827 [Flavoplaca oasis]